MPQNKTRPIMLFLWQQRATIPFPPFISIFHKLFKNQRLIENKIGIIEK